MKHGSLILALAAFLVSCQPATSPTPAAGPVTVNGTWTWATIQGIPVGSIPPAGYSGTMAVTGEASYTWNFHTASSGTDGGTVALKSAGVYTFTSSSLGGWAPYDLTLSADGKTLSGTHPFFQVITFTK